LKRNGLKIFHFFKKKNVTFEEVIIGEDLFVGGKAGFGGRVEFSGSWSEQ